MRYSIGDLIGTGSFGRVHEAHDGAGKKYAVKVVDSGDEVGLSLLRAQYRLLSAVDHPRIVTVHDLFEDAGHDPCLVMEYVNGCSLAEHIREAGIETLPRLAIQVLDALRQIHALGGTHGDLKPDNILVYEDGGDFDIKLIDVGFDASVGDSLPTIQGTLPYLAPEVIRSAPADARSDLYSLGVTLFEALTGACPFGGSSAKEIMNKHLEFLPLPPSAVDDRIDASWDEVIGRLLSKEPIRRYPGAMHAALALGRAFGDTDLVVQEFGPPRTLIHYWYLDAERVEEVISRRPGRAILVGGEPGSGTASVLRNIGARLKSGGRRVVSVAMSAGVPVSSQVIQSLAGGDAGRAGAEAEADTPISDSHLFSLDSILSAYGVSIGGGRTHAIVVEGGSVIDEAGVRAMAQLGTLHGDALDVVLGVESEGELPGSLLEKRALEVVRISRLSKDGIEEAVRRHFGVTAVPAELLDALHGNTRGSPVLLEETLADLWGKGDLRYRMSRDLLEIEWMKRAALPASLREVIEEKIDRLGETELLAAGMLALAPGRLEREVIVSTLGTRDGPRAVDNLIEIGLVGEAPERGSLRFNQDDARSLVRDRVPAAWAAETARHLAGAVEGLGTGPGDSYRIGSLYLEGDRTEQALTHLLEAGKYLGRFSISDALLAYGRALECNPREALRAEIEERMGDLKVVENDLDAAKDHFERASSHRPEASRKLGWVEALRGNYEEAERLLTECSDAATLRGDAVERASVALDLGYVYATRGKIDESLETIREARGFFEREDMAFEAGMAAYREGISQMRAGNYLSAVTAWQEAIPRFEKAGNLRLVAQSLQAIGLVSRKTLDYQKAETSLKRSLEIWSDLRGLSQRGATSNTYALVLLEMGDLRRAREQADRALELNSMAGHKNGVVLARMLMSIIELESGNWGNAEAMLSEVQRDLPPGDLYLKAQVERYLAMARTIAGDREGAVALSQQSYSSARLAGDEEGKYQALLEQGVAHLRFGNPEGAADAAGEALVGFSTESSLLLAARAQGLLGEALCLMGKADEGFEKLEAARENLRPVGRSQHMGRILLGLARASYLGMDHATFSRFFDEALEVLRGAEARYDYSVALYLGGMEAMQRGSFLRARHYLAEAARVFGSLDIEDLHEKVVRAMEAIPGGEIETRAVGSLSKISEALISSKDLDSVLNTAMDLAMDYLGADRGVLMLVPERTGELVTVVERKMDKESLQEVIDISKSIVESVHETHEAVIATDLTEDPRFMHSKSIRAHNIMAVMCLPLMRGKNLLGLIYLDTRGIPTDFSALEKAFVDAFANQVSLAVENARMVGNLRTDFEDLKDRVGERFRFDNIIGPGREMQGVFRQVKKVAPTDTSVLLTGENGTGKDLIAGLIHELSPRRAAPFIIVNCPGIADDLVESELFGIEKSVATGVAPRPGFFERADGGTIFLNEIGDLAEGIQVKVLRVIENMEFERVGGSKVIKVDVRVISATNRDLRQLLEDGSFRTDLYFRLNTIQIELPPLRKRMEDLPGLVDHFVRKYASKNSKPVKRVSPEAFDMLRRHPWPGNVRELEKCLEHAVVFADGDEIVPDNLKDEIIAAAGTGMPPTADLTGSLPDRVAKFEEYHIAEALSASDWNKTRAARSLGIHESTLRKKIRAYGIEKSRT